MLQREQLIQRGGRAYSYIIWYMDTMDTMEIRTYGDAVLRKRAMEVSDIDGRLAELVEIMVNTMHEAPGVGLAAPQVGVSKRLFTYDIGRDLDDVATPDNSIHGVIINPTIVESRGEWTYEEGCLSVPGFSWHITRPKEVYLKGYNLEGEEISIEADELFARVLLHEIDHLDGVLLVDRLDKEERKQALKALRERSASPTGQTLL